MRDFLFVMLTGLAGNVYVASVFGLEGVFTSLLSGNKSVGSIPGTGTINKSITWNVCLHRLYSRGRVFHTYSTYARGRYVECGKPLPRPNFQRPIKV
jgi:hypothetical protein